MASRGFKAKEVAYQAAALAAVLVVGWFFVSNTQENLEARRIASGFGFLLPAGTDPTLNPHRKEDSCRTNCAGLLSRAWAP